MCQNHSAFDCKLSKNVLRMFNLNKFFYYCLSLNFYRYALPLLFLYTVQNAVLRNKMAMSERGDGARSVKASPPNHGKIKIACENFCKTTWKQHAKYKVMPWSFSNVIEGRFSILTHCSCIERSRATERSSSSAHYDRQEDALWINTSRGLV